MKASLPSKDAIENQFLTFDIVVSGTRFEQSSSIFDRYSGTALTTRESEDFDIESSPSSSCSDFYVAVHSKTKPFEEISPAREEGDEEENDEDHDFKKPIPRVNKKETGFQQLKKKIKKRHREEKVKRSKQGMGKVRAGLLRLRKETFSTYGVWL
jgi:hypothetical protein